MGSPHDRIEVVGRRDPESGRAELTVQGDGRTWQLPIDGHSPGAGEWGFGSLTVRATARAILKEATGGDHPDTVVTAFEEEVLAQLPREGFALGEVEIRAWLAGRGP